MLALVALAGAGCGSRPAQTPQGQAGQSQQPAAPAQAQEGSGANQGTSASATTDDDLAWYKGKTVTWIVSTSTGGGYDTYARMIAPYLQKYLPGSTVIVKNVPGAGHIIGVNELYKSKPDGLTLGIFNAGLIFQQLAGAKGIEFDLANLTFLGNATSDPRVFIVGTNTPYKTFQDVLQNSSKVRMGSAGVGSASHNDVLMLNKIFGANMKPVPGFSGREADLAMLRGELDGQIGQANQMDQLIENGQARAVLVITSGQLDKTKYPDASSLLEVTPDSGKSLANLMVAIASLSRPIAAPPGLPAGRAKVLREALWKAMNDPELQAKANQAKLPIQPLNADETVRLFGDALKQPPEVVDLIKQLVQGEKK